MDQSVLHGIKQNTPIILRYFLRIGLWVQALFGLIWLGCNFFTIQDFRESVTYLEDAKYITALFGDGGFYPFLLYFVRMVLRWLPFSYVPVVYILQLGIAWGAGYKLFRALRVTTAGWNATLLLFSPTLLQCHLAILPHSITSSILLLMIAEGIRAKSEEQPSFHTLWLYLLGWVMAAEMTPSYGLYCAPAWLFLLYQTIHKRVRVRMHIHQRYLALVLIVGLCVGVCVRFVTSEKLQFSFATATLSRVSWPIINKTYPNWPSEALTVFPKEYREAILTQTQDVFAITAPTLEEAYGPKQATRLIYRIIPLALDYHTKQVMKQIMTDASGYLFAPTVLAWQLQGGGYESYASANYDRLTHQAPMLTKVWIRYSAYFLAAGLLVTLMLCKRRARSQSLPWIIMGTSMMMVILETMRGSGIMDYKNALFINLMWMIWMITRSTLGEQT
jgi:hypothetical protein